MILAVCGYGTHGKGTAALYLARNSRLRYRQLTSEFAAKIVFERLKNLYGYRTAQEAWGDRHNHRDVWAETIWQYNQPDGLTLYREMLSQNDILEGVRKSSELQALYDAGVIDLSIWIDASKRLPREPSSSCQITAADTDLVIDNNGSLPEMESRLDAFIQKYLEGEASYT